MMVYTIGNLLSWFVSVAAVDLLQLFLERIMELYGP